MSAISFTTTRRAGVGSVIHELGGRGEHIFPGAVGQIYPVS